MPVFFVLRRGLVFHFSMFITPQPCELSAVRDLLNLMIHCSKLQQWLYYGQERNQGHSPPPGTTGSVHSVHWHRNPLLNTRWTSQNGFVTSPCRRTFPGAENTYWSQCYPAAEVKKKKRKKKPQLFYFSVNSRAHCKWTAAGVFAERQQFTIVGIPATSGEWFSPSLVSQKAGSAPVPVEGKRAGSSLDCPLQ